VQSDSHPTGEDAGKTLFLLNRESSLRQLFVARFATGFVNHLQKKAPALKDIEPRCIGNGRFL